MHISIGRIVQYRLAKDDLDRITTIRQGNIHAVGQVLPMIVVLVWQHDDKTSVNGQVFLDGNDQLWATSVTEGHQYEPGTWSWPERT